MDDFGKLYSRYKKDTQYVLYYLTNVTNGILRSLPGKSQDDGLVLNTSGQVPASSLIPMSNLLKKHKSPVPHIIIQLLSSIIYHRSQAHGSFLRMAAETPDPEMERSNESHKAFILILQQVLENLRGLAVRSSATADATANTEKEAEEHILSNRFDALVIGADDDLDESDAESNDPEDATLPGRPTTRSRPKCKKRSGKKNSKSRNQKRQGQSSGGARSDPPDVPLESYRIIEDFRSQGPGGPGLMTDYFILTRGIFQRMAQFRCDMQDLWREVAYEGVNTAIAGGTSLSAVALVRKMTLSIFAEFPGNEAYGTLWNTITRGDPDRVASSFAVSAFVTMAGECEPVIRRISVEIREQFLYYTYCNLCDFITDWQLNRNGKPTKRMQAELKGWKPDFDLAGATKEERRQWRRVYTINWLYDLVNVYQAISDERQATETQHARPFRQRNPGSQKKNAFFDDSTQALEDLWPRLFGLDEFAGFIAGLLRQCTDSKTLLRILPEHVFQLQLIVDSFMVSRGWSTTGLKGHVIIPPPLSFSPRRDELSFLDRSEKLNMGFIRSASLISRTFYSEASRYQDFSRYGMQLPLVEWVTKHMRDWLGESKDVFGPSATTPSRFNETNPNGLWEYSPFLCGVALLECLEMAYSVGTGLMDKCPEVTLLVHLHYKLLCKRYLREPSSLWLKLTETFRPEFYKDSVLPTSDFDKALRSHLGEQIYNSPVWRRSVLRKRLKTGIMRSSTNPKANLFFREKPVIRVLREAEWDLDAMPPEEISVFSVIACMRIQRAKRREGLPSNKREEGDQVILRRARVFGDQLPALKDAADQPKSKGSVRGVAKQTSPQTSGAMVERVLVGGPVKYEDGEDPYALLMVRADLEHSITGRDPIFGISYLNLITLAILTLLKMEVTLEAQNNATWRSSRTFAPGERRFAFDRRFRLIFSALETDDPECLSTMANIMLEIHYSFDMLTYWDQLANNRHDHDGTPHEHAHQSDSLANNLPDMEEEEKKTKEEEETELLRLTVQPKHLHLMTELSPDERAQHLKSIIFLGLS